MWKSNANEIFETVKLYTWKFSYRGNNDEPS